MSVVANVAINVDSRDAVSKLRQVESQAATTERAFGALQSALGALGVGFALTKVIADVKELDTNLRRLGTVGVDVKNISPALSKLSDELGGVASKAELAAASYQAASAGFSDTAGNINILRAATKAAVGGLADTQAVTEVLVKTLNSYGLAGDQATKVTDSISKAVELGNQEWSDYTSQLGRVASIAALAGVSLDEVNAFIASATKNGATAEIAFTGLGATLNTLLQPTKESQEAAAKLGIAWNYGGLQAKGFTGLMAELAIAMEKDKETTAKLLGSQEAMRGAFAANAKGGRDYKMVLGELSGAAGKTDADFQTMKVSLENALKALDTSFKNLSEALGKAFGKAVVSTIEDVTDTVNAFADAINAVPKPVAAAIAEIVKIVAQMILLQKAIQAIIALRAGFVAAMTGMAATTAATGAAATASSSAFALYTANTRTLQSAAATATPTLVGLRSVLASLASIGTIAIAVNIAVYGIQSVMQARAELDRLRGARQAGGAAAAFGGSAPAESKESARKTLAAIEAERKKNLPMQAIGAISGFGRGLGNTRESILSERERFARGVLALPTRTAQTPALNATNTPVGATVGGGGKGRGGKSDAEKAAEKAAREAERLRQQTEQQLQAAKDLQFTQANQLLQLRAKNDFERTFVEFGIKRSEIERKYNELLQQSKSTEETKLLQQARAAEYKQSSLILEQRALELTKQATQPLDDILKNLQDQAAYQREYGELIKNGTNPELAKQIIEINRAYEASVAALEPAIAAARAAITKAEAEGAAATEIEKYRKELERIQEIQGGLEGKRSQAVDAAKEGAAKKPTVLDGIGARIKQLQADLDPVKVATDSIVNGADAIGQAFGQAFQDVATGAKSTQEALADAFESIGKAFISMAAEIIAKQMTLIILQTIFNALSGALGGSGSKSAVVPGVDVPLSEMPAGMAFRANGGPVSSNTPYIVGERGPELFVPSSSGSVMSNADTRAALAEQSAARSTNDTRMALQQKPIDVRYESSVINNVEYVTADQHRKGLAQAAERGRALTLAALQNSTRTRKKVGI